MRALSFSIAIRIGILIYGTLTTGLMLLSGSAIAQVTPDGSLRTTVTQSGNNFAINHGNRVGNNLFHSFDQFSVPTNGSAVFNNAADVQNIFSRITGGSISNINGLIQANGTADLFLLNPRGVLFGPNARLNVGGSFVGTTASSIQFADGVAFNAVNSTPLLTLSAPIGLQMGSNPGAIAVQGTGHRLIATSPFAPLDPSNNPVGLQAGIDRSLMLIGGAVDLAGGVMAAQGGGHLEIGSVQAGNRVNLNRSGLGWIGDYSAVQQFSDIHLAQQSLLNATGRSNSVLLQGKNISLTEGSTLFMQNFGLERSGDITVRATGTLNLTGNTADGRLGSLIQLDNFGTGAAGDVTIAAAAINLLEGGSIVSRMYSPGLGGNVSVNVADSIVIDGVAPANPVAAASISTTTYGPRDAGDVTIVAGRLRILNGGSFSSLTVGAGKAGTVRVNASDLVEVAGNNSITLTPSTLVSTSFGTGNATDVLINTAKLVVRNGGIVGSSAYVTAAAGNVMINASESLDLQGRPLGSITASRIASTAEILDPVTQAAYGLPPIPLGDAGSLVINTPALRITDGAYVTVENDGPGKAGDLEINSRSIFLNNQGAITASTASGNGGNLRLNVQDSLLLRRGSNISATAAGQGDGGNLSIHAPTVIGLENSDITASAVQGQGGKITLTTQGILGLAFRPRLTPENDIVASSEFGISGTVEINTMGIDPNSGLIELPMDLVDSTQQVTAGCADSQNSSFVITGRGGIPDNPTAQFSPQRPWNDVRSLPTGPAVTAQSPTSPQTQPLVETTGWRRNDNGQVELLTSTDTRTATTPPVATCSAAG